MKGESSILTIGMICLGSARNAQDGSVSFAMSDTAESENPNALENAILSTYMQPTLTMILAIRHLYCSVCALPVTVNMIIAIV